MRYRLVARIRSPPPSAPCASASPCVDVLCVWSLCALQLLTDEESDFVTKIRIKSGLARDGTYLPHSIHPEHW